MMMFARLSVAVGLVALCGLSVAGPARAGGYAPVGPQENVPVQTVLNGGWQVCYSANIGAPFGLDAATTLAPCTGSQIMVAGRLKDSDTYAVLATAPKADALVDTGANTSNTHVVNGSQWYNSSLWAFGFAPADDQVVLSSCDMEAGDRRICVHTFSAVGGFRIGNNMNLNNDSNWELVVLTSP
jgi:hypothetical protein